MKHLIVLSLLLMGSLAAFAQDIIVKKDGSDIKAIVLEVDLDIIKFKKYDNPNGPDYKIRISDIQEIIYENGTKDIFVKQQPQPETELQPHMELEPEAALQPQTIQPSEQPIAALPEIYYDGKVKKDGVKLKRREVLTLMAGNYEALDNYKSGRDLLIVGELVLVFSSYWFGKGIAGTMYGEEDALMIMTSASLGLAGGILIMVGGEQKVKKSVDLYNKKRNIAYQLDYGIIDNGIGFCLRF